MADPDAVPVQTKPLPLYASGIGLSPQEVLFSGEAPQRPGAETPAQRQAHRFSSPGDEEALS